MKIVLPLHGNLPQHLAVEVILHSLFRNDSDRNLCNVSLRGGLIHEPVLPLRIHDGIIEITVALVIRVVELRGIFEAQQFRINVPKTIDLIFGWVGKFSVGLRNENYILILNGRFPFGKVCRVQELEPYFDKCSRPDTAKLGVCARIAIVIRNQFVTIRWIVTGKRPFRIRM